jgi:hypothetical protein
VVVGGNPQVLRELAARVRAESHTESQECSDLGAALAQAEVIAGDAELSHALAELTAVLRESTGTAVDLLGEAGSALEADALALERAFGGGVQ